MGKVILWLLAGFAGLVILGSIVGPQGSDVNDPDARSVGRLGPGECMSADRYNSRAATVVGNTDWSKVEGSATFSASKKFLIGGVTGFKEMARLGTRACPDLAYDRYLAGSAPRPASAQAAPTRVPATQRATLTTGVNIRSGPSASASVVRVARKGDRFTVLDMREGWVQVGGDAPEGWVAANLLKR